ncbi:MAG TPA: HPF/RaiA family ribosome-associated protein [Roseiarcus sp.]|nr:HPF/RaiA family ribosome-associated protein [Roseiarcus sp.]
MQTPVEIAFRHCEPSDEMHAEIAEQVRRLDQFGPSITSCRVVVTGPSTRHRNGGLFRVGLFIAMPEHKEVVVDGSHGDAPEREHPLVAIREAFDAAVRQIEDAQREMRGQVKQHVAESRGRVTKLLAAENCGFIETPDGREVYFHRNAVLEGAFDRLRVGSEVHFEEEEGEKGAQASMVRLVRGGARSGAHGKIGS